MDSKFLDENMLIEIMSRTPLKSLGNISCVSKKFNKLTQEPCVHDSLKKNKKMVSGYLMQNSRSDWTCNIEFAPSLNSTGLDLGHLPYNSCILATSEQGIMVIRNLDPMDFWNEELYHVCKPATKQVLALPNPKPNEEVEKFAIVVMGSKPLHYKIIRFTDQPVLRRWGKLYSAYGCDIFDSLTWEWRSLKHVKLPYCVHLTDMQPVTVSGSIYMLLSNNDVLKFDAYTEKWKVFSSPIPYDIYGYSNPSIVLVKYDGRLGLVCESTNANDCWEIWVRKMNGLMWEKEDVAVEISKSEWGSIKALYGTDTSVMVDGNTLVFYRFKQHGNDVINKVVLKGIPSGMFSFRSDFEPVDLVQPHAELSSPDDQST